MVPFDPRTTDYLIHVSQLWSQCTVLFVALRTEYDEHPESVERMVSEWVLNPFELIAHLEPSDALGQFHADLSSVMNGMRSYLLRMVAGATAEELEIREREIAKDSAIVALELQRWNDALQN